MVKSVSGNSVSGSGEIWRGLVLYEDAPAREFAARASRVLSASPSSEESRQVFWHSFSALADAATSRDLATLATQADLIVFSAPRTGDWPTELKLWIESWILQRGEREGVIVGILIPEDPTGSVEIASLKEVYLRHAAHRAGMDYLNEVPPGISHAIPDSLDSFSARAGQITSLLDEILNTAAQQSTMRR